MTTKQNIEKVLWNACDSFRGKIDSSRYKDYILSMLFVKYLSDVYAETKEKYIQQYNGDKCRIERAMKRERFVMGETSTFSYLYQNRNDTEIGQKINVALSTIENNNSSKLHNVFRAIDFNSSVDFGEVKEKNAILRNLLEDFKDLDLRPSQLDTNDIIGDAYEYMIANFASDAGKKGGEFYTPGKVSELVARLVQPRENDRIYDPTCGSGGLLLKAYKQIGSNKTHIYGQEKNMQTWALCRMNMFLHGFDSARIEWGDTINNPLLVSNKSLMKFDIVVANPPFSLDKWGAENAASDPYRRFTRGIPPKSKGDWAFITHMVETAKNQKGRIAVVVPHGVLFRGGAELKIRQSMIEENLLDAVIGLPSNLFPTTGIPVAILVFDRSREKGGSREKETDVMFIDASKEFVQGKKQNTLSDEQLDKIVETYKARRDVEKYSRKVPFEEIKNNELRLNIPRYVDTYEEEEEIDIDAVQSEIDRLETELAEVRSQMKKKLADILRG